MVSSCCHGQRLRRRGIGYSSRMGVAMAAAALASAASGMTVAAPRKAMAYNKLGSSDLMVSSCCLGTMTWGNQNTDEEAAEQLCAAWDAGVNFLDTAEGYPVPMTAERQGATDRAIGRWLTTTKQPRDGVIIATKMCGFNDRFTWFREDGGARDRTPSVPRAKASHPPGSSMA